MADLSDVTAALGKMVEAALYPGQNPPAGNSVAGMAVLVQVGWPDPKSLMADLAAAKAQVTIYPRPMERNVTRYPRTWNVGAHQAKTFTLTRSGQQITVGGAQPATVGFQGQSPSSQHALETVIATGIEANIQAQKAAGKEAVGLPGDGASQNWRVYTPRNALAAGVVQNRDIITDDLGRRFQVVADYVNSLGAAFIVQRLEP